MQQHHIDFHFPNYFLHLRTWNGQTQLLIELNNNNHLSLDKKKPNSQNKFKTGILEHEGSGLGEWEGTD